MNEDALYAVLEPLGYVKIVLSSLSVSEQAALFAGATHVVGLHGAGLSHVVFMTERAMVIEIFPDSYGTPAYYILTAGMENRYATYNVKNVVANSRTQLDDVVVDVADFMRRCADLI